MFSEEATMTSLSFFSIQLLSLLFFVLKNLIARFSRYGFFAFGDYSSSLLGKMIFLVFRFDFELSTLSNGTLLMQLRLFLGISREGLIKSGIDSLILDGITTLAFY